MITLLSLFAIAAGTVSGTVTRSGDADLTGVVIYLDDLQDAAPIKPAPKIYQRDLTFIPEINVITVGTTMEFPNEDKRFHNIFSLSEAAKFDLGLYRSGESKRVTFTNPGTVDIYCNIHPQMIAKIKVVPTRHFVRPGQDGRFVLSGVPAGKHTLVAWQAYGDDVRAEADVQDGKTLELSLTLVAGKKTKHHVRKDGTPYGRYK